MNTATLLNLAKEEAEKRYPKPERDSHGDDTLDSEMEQNGFLAGVEWAIQQLKLDLKTVWVWTKASERLPGKDGIYNGRIKGISASTLAFYKGHFYYEFDDKRDPLKMGVFEWLEETTIAESDAVGFADWVNAFYHRANAERYWRPRKDGGMIITNNLKTTEELYQLFKQSK